MTIALDVDTKLFVNKQPGGMFSIRDVAETPGKTWWVGSNVTGASDTAGYGQNPGAPFATIEYAASTTNCLAQRGDVVYVLPKHAEAIAAAGDLSFAIEGVTIIGLGNGDNRPTITQGTATTADVDIDAANITLKNLRFVSNINSLAVMLDVNFGNLVVEDCDFISSSAKEVVNFVNIATTKDNFTFRRCKFFQPSDPEGTNAAAGTGCFYFVDSENIFVEDCFFYGHFETAIFHNRTTAAKNVWISGCQGTQLGCAAANAFVWVQVANMEGGCRSSLLLSPGATDATEAKICGTCSDKFYVNVDVGFGNDGAGGQLAIPGVAAAT